MTAIRFDHVSKRFTLRLARPHSFQDLFLNLLHPSRSPSKKEEYWAVRDVTFDIENGHTVALIGPNGAGKSTVLKLISGIIEPTSGRIAVDGRVGALLELGAGFHPDLTGRENVYLNSSILGFSRAKARAILDDVISFSEMERFIDVPVKHYSSGMYMRLAFSVAIHVDPEILLIDEVLAVGDQAFQSRCLDKISQMKREGVTIVLVTHMLDAVRDLCDRAIWLDDGEIQAQGSVDSVLEAYTADVMAQDTAATLADEHRERPRRTEEASRWGSREAEVVALRIMDAHGAERRSYRTGETVVVRIEYVAHERIERPRFGLALYRAGGFHISGPNTVFSGYPIPEIEGAGFVDYTIEHLPLLPGTYLVSAAIYDHDGEHAYDHLHQRYTFRVREGGVREQFGTFYIPATWKHSPGQSFVAQSAGQGEE